ncbi:MAG: aminoacyl-tRNA hydrolase [Dehalobacterium sp.]|jgi:PTH1 family peptidyl-tRNA hydrolase
MKIIVGLGNPGSQYEATRHNVGFMTVDLLAENLNIEFRKQGHFSLMGESRINGQKVLLMKPMTFMNLSGRAVRDVVDFFKIDLRDLLIIYDDMDLPPGRIRIRPGGSGGGHNGMNSIIKHLSGGQIARIKIGIGRPEREPAEKYVLMPFPDQDWDLVKSAIEKGAQAAEDWLKEGLDYVMNRYNRVSSEN